MGRHGVTNGGIANKELLPGKYDFRITYEGKKISIKQDVSTNPVVIFQTINTQVEFWDSSGNPLDGGIVTYEVHKHKWEDYGVTTGGFVNRELLPGKYKFWHGPLGSFIWYTTIFVCVLSMAVLGLT